MKEKREIILFFTRLLMLAVMLAVLFGVIFGMTSAKNQDMSPKRSAFILQAGTEIFRPGCRGIPKRGDIAYRAYCGERER